MFWSHLTRLNVACRDPLPVPPPAPHHPFLPNTHRLWSSLPPSTLPPRLEPCALPTVSPTHQGPIHALWSLPQWHLSTPLFSFPDYPSIFCETRHRNYTVFELPSWRFWGYLSAKGRHGPSARTSASAVWCGGKEWNGVYLVFAKPVSTVHHGRGLYWNSISHSLILSSCR